MLDEHVEFLEGAFVEEHGDALARRQLAALVLRGDALGAAALAGDLAPPFQLDQHFLHAMFPDRCAVRVAPC